MKRKHLMVYLIEFAIIGGGFALLLAVSFPIYQQLTVLAGILFLYILVGLAHHKMHRDFHVKVMLEYILISAIIFSLFIFLNISRL